MTSKSCVYVHGGTVRVASQAFAKVDFQQCRGTGIRDLHLFSICVLCGSPDGQQFINKIVYPLKEIRDFWMYIVIVSFVLLSAYFKVTLYHFFCKTGPQYSKSISFSLTSVHINLHRKKNLILHFRKEI